MPSDRLVLVALEERDEQLLTDTERQLIDRLKNGPLIHTRERDENSLRSLAGRVRNKRADLSRREITELALIHIEPNRTDTNTNETVQLDTDGLTHSTNDPITTLVENDRDPMLIETNHTNRTSRTIIENNTLTDTINLVILDRMRSTHHVLLLKLIAGMSDAIRKITIIRQDE